MTSFPTPAVLPDARERTRAVSERLVAEMRRVARQDGWALAVHGSMSRDLDLIAVPWTDHATDETAFVEAMRASMARTLGGIALIGAGEDGRTPGVKAKPHGRRSWTIHSTSDQLVETEAGAHPYVDLCVLDQRATPPASDAAVPAGEVKPQEYLDFADAMHARLFYPSGATRDDARPYQIARQLGMAVRILANALAAAPKVASDTGAGLLGKIEAEARRYASHYPQGSDGQNTFVMFADYVAALATHTDATDGATGGGEVTGEALFRAFMAGDVSRLTTTALPEEWPHMQPSYRQAWNDLAMSLTTTPGGDLLEQAARWLRARADECHAEADNANRTAAARHDQATAAITLDAAANEISRALKPAGDGGEA